MSHPSWTMGLYLTALRDNLRARPDLAGVQVMSAPIKRDEVEQEVITFIDINSDEESAALGAGRREEVYIIEGIIEVSLDGFGEDVAVAARDRALELLAEVEIELRENPSQGLNTTSQLIRMSEIMRKELRQRISDQVRRAAVEFDVRVSTRIG